MASIDFVDYSTVVPASWLNDVNDAVYNQTSGLSGAIARSLASKLGDVVSVKDFGAVGDGVADDTAAFGLWTTNLNSRGGGVAVIPPGTYKVTCPLSSALCSFTSSIDGLVILAGGAIIDDVQSGYGTTLNSTLFRFTGSKNVAVPNGLRVETYRSLITYGTFEGLSAFELLEGCSNFDISVEIDGGLSAVKSTRAFDDPLTYNSSNIKVNVVAVRTHYPYLSQFSGDDIDVEINGTECGRNFFLYGTNGVKMRVHSKNQQSTSLIQAYNGYGNSDVSVYYYDRDSDDCQPAAPVMAIEWGDSTPARHSNIDIRLDVKNPTAAPWGNTISMAKYSDGGGTPDSTGRGHVLDGFRISGVSDNTGVAGKNHFNWEAGLFASPDVQRGVVVENFTALGTDASMLFSLPVLSSPAVFNGVECETNINTSNGTTTKCIFVGCKMANFCTFLADTSAHDYISCVVTDGTSQNLEDNKTFINTSVVGVMKNAPSVLPRDKVVLRATKTLTGSLTGTNNIFKVSPALASGAVFRLKYALVADGQDFDPLTRDETFGIKSFSATMTGLGIWEAQLAVADEVTERTQGTASAVTVSLVDGDATGAHIAVACTNYSTAAARGYFEIEMISMSGLLESEIKAV
jgi:hypothetical protein